MKLCNVSAFVVAIVVSFVGLAILLVGVAYISTWSDSNGSEPSVQPVVLMPLPDRSAERLLNDGPPMDGSTFHA